MEVTMTNLPAPTLTAQLLQERLRQLDIRAGELKPWTRAHGLREVYELLSENIAGRRVSKDRLLVRVALQLGLDPVIVVLTAHADRAQPPFKQFFLAARQRYEAFPQVAQGWAALDDRTRQKLLAIIARPALVRKLVQLVEELQSQEEGHDRTR
jgi:hypothetical protein